MVEFDTYKYWFLEALKTLGADISKVEQKDYDVYCKCPICGDSKFKNKKRLHLYKKDNVINVNCFNGDCSVKSMHPVKFLKEYTHSVFLNFKESQRSQNLKKLVESKINIDDFSFEENETAIDIFIKNFEIEGKQKDFNKLAAFINSLSDDDIKLFLKKIKDA